MQRYSIDLQKTLIAAALAAGLGFGTVTVNAAEPAAPEAHSDSVGAALADTATTARVKAKLMGKRILRHSDVDVTTTNGVVTLTGTASGPKAMDFAVEAAKAVEGVKSVDSTGLIVAAK